MTQKLRWGRSRDGDYNQCDQPCPYMNMIFELYYWYPTIYLLLLVLLTITTIYKY